MLKLARLQPGEVVVDLGCGDGRLLQRAIDMGAARAIGYELDGDLVAAARTSISDERVQVHQANVLEASTCVQSADIVALYLTERGNATVLPMLRANLKPSARVVSYVWPMPGVPPRQTATATGGGAVFQLGGNVLLWEQADLIGTSPTGLGKRG